MHALDDIMLLCVNFEHLHGIMKADLSTGGWVAVCVALPRTNIVLMT